MLVMQYIIIAIVLTEMGGSEHKNYKIIVITVNQYYIILCLDNYFLHYTLRPNSKLLENSQVGS